MKSKLAAILALLVLSGALALPVAARTKNMPKQETPGIDRREQRQQRRIRRGVRNGSLTAREARHLERREQKIQRTETRIESDGTVTRHERRRFNRMLNRENRGIRRQRHDRQRERY